MQINAAVMSEKSKATIRWPICSEFGVRCLLLRRPSRKKDEPTYCDEHFDGGKAEEMTSRCDDILGILKLRYNQSEGNGEAQLCDE